jgi:hypothetical protein
VIYVELSKALYGMVQVVFLFWKKLTAFLRAQGFESNTYNLCVINKNVNGNQLTVGWHVDDLKIITCQR